MATSAVDLPVTESVVAVENLVKRFPGTVAVNDVSFGIAPGSVHALVGENGAGKSTVIKMLSGVYPPSSGQILVSGRPVAFRTPVDAQAAGITTVHQERSLISTLSALDNIFLGREEFTGRGGRVVGLVDSRRMYEKVRRLCEEFHFDPRNLHKPVEELGPFDMQVVEIIKALAFNADLIIMDEPTGGLSEQERQILFSQMKRLKQRNVAVLWVTHQLEELRDLADRVTVMRDGELVATVHGADVSASEVARMMVGRDVESIESVVADTKADDHGAHIEADEVLRVERLSCGIVRGASLAVRRGEIVGLGGLQGSGSTELLEAVIGARRPESGTIYLNGKPVRIDSTMDAFREGLAYVPDERKNQGIFPLYGVMENITMGALDRFSRLGLVRRAQEKTAARKFFQKLNIKATGVEQKISRLSGGNQQKAIIARALAVDPAVILFNEPTEGVDVGARMEIYRLLNDFVDHGGAALVKSSDLVELLGISDRVLVMREGELVGELPGFARLQGKQERRDLEERFMHLASAV